MLHIAACLWDANRNSQAFSRCYDETWVEKLYRGFRRNLTMPFRFVCFTDRDREFKEPIYQQRLTTKEPGYGCLIEPFRLNEPTIICGLDMVVVGNVDHLANYCLTREFVALPRDPYRPERSINPVALVPSGYRRIFDDWRGENDMEWLRRFPCAFIDDLWPGHLLSLKAHRVRDLGPQGARIIYMHGEPKPPALVHLDWIKQHWI